MGVLIDDHAMKLRDVRVRKVLSDARASLVGHVPRERRIAAALELARSNVAKFDPKRLTSRTREQQLQHDAAAARQARVERILGAARDTLRTAHARVAPGAPAPTSPRKDAAPPSGAAMEDLVRRFETLREAVPEVVAELRTEWQRENDLLRREIDVTHRELDLLRRTLAGSRA